MVLKTREKLIEAARQLFANKGIENTTMNDIANASEKGRRTIYTYFKNKREIYNAVVEHESEQLVSSLREVVATEDISPAEQLKRFLYIRVDILRSAVARHSSRLRPLMWRDARRFERVRELVYEKEAQMLDVIVRRGIDSGDFNRAQSERLFPLLLVVSQGIDISFLQDNFSKIGLDKFTFCDDIVNFIINGIKNKQ